MIVAELPAIPSYEDWRDVARSLLARDVRPDEVAWRTCDAPDLFADGVLAPPANAVITVPRTFVDLARKAVLHRDPQRFALLYRVLYRIQTRRMLLEDAADTDVFKLNALANAVRRDEHKMHAFVRFKEITADHGPRFVAWFEPQHHILKETADFFVRRFAGMRWSIITPDASAHWDGERLSFGPGGARADAPADDARDDDWRTYYESMFNPARLKVQAMKREMPKHYWRNLPEAELLPGLIRAAGARTEAMVEAGPTTPRKRPGAAHASIAQEPLAPELAAIAVHETPPADLHELNRALKACRACPLWRDATQTVPGEGAIEPLLALVGEQPGDQEDLAGRPFVGPAGQVLDRALEEAGLERSALFITNAVKHFKHAARGKRRLHQRPNTSEIEACRWWLVNELTLVRPRLVVALGATALGSLSDFQGSIQRARERELVTREGAPLRATVHPSYLLRLPDEAARTEHFALFVRDLKSAHLAAQNIASRVSVAPM